jgi:hypothetical protein
MSSRARYCPVCGKRMPDEFWNDVGAIKCPECAGFRTRKDSKRYTKNGVSWGWELNPYRVETSPAKFPFFHSKRILGEKSKENKK